MHTLCLSGVLSAKDVRAACTAYDCQAMPVPHRQAEIAESAT